MIGLHEEFSRSTNSVAWDSGGTSTRSTAEPNMTAPYSMTKDRVSQILVVSATLDQAINKSAVKLIKLSIDDDSADLPPSQVDILTFNWPVVFLVALAIAPGSESPYHDDPPESPDSYLADHGFEYIDGERTRHLKRRRRSPEYRHRHGRRGGRRRPRPGFPVRHHHVALYGPSRAGRRRRRMQRASRRPLATRAHVTRRWTDRGSFFPPEHGFEDADADPRMLVGRDERVCLTGARAPFDLADILASPAKYAGGRCQDRKRSTAEGGDRAFCGLPENGGEGEGTKG
ncbi:hypothetical protein EDB86DRAFT_2832495 [Lactarius hatsudake]|nr:hypothetical protein EDB86DRAFT_2832495 [Lactarius hatsudake]